MTITIKELWAGFACICVGRILASHIGLATSRQAFDDISIVGLCAVIASVYAWRKS